MAYIAVREDPTTLVSAAEIAEAESIPPYYLAKVLQDLARSGILSSVRGRGGGFRMARAAEEIRVLEVLAAVENVRALTSECVLGLDECNDEVSCPLHNTWKRVRDRLMLRLEQMTVADLAVELRRKRRYLGKRVPATDIGQTG